MPILLHLVTLIIVLFLHVIILFSSAMAIQLLLQSYPIEIKVSSLLDRLIWHILFLLLMILRFGNKLLYIGIMVLLFVKNIGVALWIGLVSIRGEFDDPNWYDATESTYTLLLVKGYYTFDEHIFYLYH